MTFSDLHGSNLPGSAQETSAGDVLDHPLFEFLNKYGARTMAIELTILTLATFGCIATDAWYERRTVIAGVEETENDAGTRTDESVSSSES